MVKLQKSYTTEKQELFCVKFVETQNRLEAYLFAGYTNNGDAQKRADSIYANPKVQARIKELSEQAGETADVTMAMVLRRFWQIATADATELINLKVGCCRYCYGEGGHYQYRMREYTDLVAKWEENQRKNPRDTTPCPEAKGGFGYDATKPPSPKCEECHGEGLERVVARDTTKLSGGARLLYGGVEQTRNGLKIHMADPMKALENVTRILGGFKDNISAAVEVKAVTAAIDMEVKDPEKAAQLYQDFIRTGLAKK